jgi:uncharacterized protein (TIGR02271 family)
MTTSPSGRPVVDVIEEGLDLYSRDEQPIGHIAEINPDFMLVEARSMGEEYLYVPRDAEERTEGNHVYLNVDLADVTSQGWSQAPEGWTESDRSAWDDQSSGDYRTHDMSGEGSTVVRRYEEQLQAQKTAQQVGEVGIRKDVVEEQQQLQVPVTREEVQVTRRAVDQPAGEYDADAFRDTGDTIRVPIVEEQVQITKEPRVVEEIEISKTARQDTKQVSETVRKEQVDIDDSTGGSVRDER